MSTPPAVFDSFTVERTFRAPPSRIFAAWADAEIKGRWLTWPSEHWRLIDRELDFRVGGIERVHGRLHTHDVVYTARYHAIFPGERLVYAFDLHVASQHLSVSLVTVEFIPAGDGTRLTYTEQVVFLDGVNARKARELGVQDDFDLLDGLLG